MQLSSIPIRAEGVINRALDGEAVLIHPQQGRVRVLNSVGARVWELADGTRSIGEIAEQLSAEYDVGLDRVQEDVLIFCGDLSERGVMECDATR